MQAGEPRQEGDYNPRGSVVRSALTSQDYGVTGGSSAHARVQAARSPDVKLRSVPGSFYGNLRRSRCEENKIDRLGQSAYTTIYEIHAARAGDR